MAPLEPSASPMTACPRPLFQKNVQEAPRRRGVGGQEEEARSTWVGRRWCQEIRDNSYKGYVTREGEMAKWRRHMWKKNQTNTCEMYLYTYSVLSDVIDEHL